MTTNDDNMGCDTMPVACLGQTNCRKLGEDQLARRREVHTPCMWKELDGYDEVIGEWATQMAEIGANLRANK